MATCQFLEPGTDATQDFTLWSSTTVTNGTITSDTAHAHAGARAIKSDITSGGTTSQARAVKAGVLADAGRAVSVWVYFSSVSPASNGMFVYAKAVSDGVTILGIGLTTGGNLRICGRGATAVDGATALAANTWYRVTLSYSVTSASVWSAKCYLNGVLEASTSNTQGNLGTTGTSDLGIGLAPSSAVDTFGTTPLMTVWLDSIYVDDRSDGSDVNGAIDVTNKRPNANGTTNGFSTQIGAGGSGYGSGHSPQVNEQPLSQTNGWSMVGAGSAVTEEYNVEGSTTGDVNLTGASIVNVAGWAYAKALAPETGSIIVDGTLSNIALTSTVTLFIQNSATPTVLPASTGTDIGIRTTTAMTTVSLYENGILVAYIPASGSFTVRLLLLKFGM